MFYIQLDHSVSLHAFILYPESVSVSPLVVDDETGVVRKSTFLCFSCGEQKSCCRYFEFIEGWRLKMQHLIFKGVTFCLLKQDVQSFKLFPALLRSCSLAIMTFKSKISFRARRHTTSSSFCQRTSCVLAAKIVCTSKTSHLNNCGS